MGKVCHGFKCTEGAKLGKKPDGAGCAGRAARILSVGGLWKINVLKFHPAPFFHPRFIDISTNFAPNLKYHYEKIAHRPACIYSNRHRSSA
jgi:hypothetical protein